MVLTMARSAACSACSVHSIGDLAMTEELVGEGREGRRAGR